MHLGKPKLAQDLGLCTACSKNNYSFLLSVGNLCSQCFVKRYGEIILLTDSAEYYGGYNTYEVGRFRKHQSGHAYLTENYLIFAKEDKDEISKRWEIVISLSTVGLTWKSEEEGRKKRMVWEGTTIDNFGFGSGFLYKSGDTFHIVVPCVDEDGIFQYPRFGVSIAASQWAAQTYIQAVRTKISDPQRNISETDIPQTNTSCFNCPGTFPIYDMTVCAHCVTAFCSVCESNHSMEPEAGYQAKYLGGHKMYPKPRDAEVFVFSDRIEIPQVNLRITFFSMTNIENADEKKISALRVVGLGLVSLGVGAIVGALWKKRHIYTIIDYVDVFNEEQTLVFDFEDNLEYAQQMIYKKMIGSHFEKEQLEKTIEQKKTNEDEPDPLK